MREIERRRKRDRDRVRERYFRIEISTCVRLKLLQTSFRNKSSNSSI